MTKILPLSNLVKWVDARNKTLVSTNLLGINIEKYFMPSVANIIGTDLSSYKVINKFQFACNPMHVGRDEKMPIALYDKEEPSIVSPAYFVFEVIDSQIINPEYLMLWFKRPEFDREVWFHTDGSVRGGITWEEILEMKVPVPSIKDQLEIVNKYKNIENRISVLRQINDNLESQAYTYYQERIADKDKNSTLSDLAIITMGTSPDGDSYNDTGKGTVFYQGRSDFGFRFPTIRLYTTEPRRFAYENDILMSVRAPVGDINIAKEYCAIGRGLASLRPKDCCYSFLYYTLKQLNKELQRFNDDGTVFGSITKDDLYCLKIVSLTMEERQQFETQISKIDTEIKHNELEITYLITICSFILSQLAN